MISLERKLDRHSEAKMKYVETINQYIKDGQASKIDINKSNNIFKIKYILNQAVTNINKIGKTGIVFNVGAKV